MTAVHRNEQGKNWVRYGLFCAVCILINLALAQLPGLFRLPLYLDSVGTMLAAALGGCVPGVIVGYLTNIINGLQDITNIYYGMLNVLIAVSAAFFARRGWFKKVTTLLLSVLVFALIGGALGSVLTWLIFGFDFGTGISAPLAKRIFDAGVLNPYLAQLSADLLLDILDKAITVAAVVLVMKLLPESVRTKCLFHAWRQRPLQNEEKQAVQRCKTRKMSLRSKIVIMVSASMLLVALATVSLSFVMFRQAMLDAQVGAEQLRLAEYAFLAKAFSLFVGFSIVILSLGIWLADYRLILPINAMALSAGGFASDGEALREESVEKIRGLQIRTGDEIENLYQALSKMSSDTVRYIADVQQKNATIARMQESLITVLADIVESRDKYTGNHVRNTAAYARIIMEQLRRENIYTDLLTDDFISDVLHSAPLHDVGKIHISDTLLNKPGRLNDEEYGRMKEHTLAGREIIAQAMTAASDSTYLNEAQNLATYHHEHWDGTGYPFGLSGERIPLSARIMAVADVFDALVSKRSYKEGFSVDQALDIIRSGIGTHFDPKVANAFLHAQEEARKIAEEHKASDQAPAQTEK